MFQKDDMRRAGSIWETPTRLGESPMNMPTRVLKSIDCMPTKTLSVTVQETPKETAAMSSRATKVGFVSLGCPKNLVDSEVMMGMLQRAGAELVSGRRGR